MPRGGSTSSRSSEGNQEYRYPTKNGARKRTYRSRTFKEESMSEDEGIAASIPLRGEPDVPSAAPVTDLEGIGFAADARSLAAASSHDPQELIEQERKTVEEEPETADRDILQSSTVPNLQTLTTSRLAHTISYTGTGLSDDGRSLTPEPNSSEAETEHLVSGDEAAHENNAEYAVDELTQVSGYNDEDLEVPDDLDNLSDSDSHTGIQPAVLNGPHDEEDDNNSEADSASEEGRLMEEDDLEAGLIASPQPQSIVRPSDNEDIKGADIMASLADNIPLSDIGTIGIQPETPPRKRKRSHDQSPINAKRLAPRKVHADLDSDEEHSEALGRPELNMKETEDEELKDVFGNNSIMPADHDEDVPDTATNMVELEEESAKNVEVEQPEERDEDEEEDVEEEVQDDTEREERNRHRQAAMDALRQIEIDFSRLRTRLYQERMTQIEREISLAESCEHPLLVEKAEQNKHRHVGRISRAEVLRERRQAEAEAEYRAHKFMAHSQFAQDKQKLRATLLSKTSAEWFQIHREKRVLDMAVPEYGYVLPDRKSVQTRHRREFEEEVSILSGLKKFVGFPAAPPMPVAAAKDIEADLAEMGIVKSIAAHARDSHRSNQVQRASPHGHASMTAHLNHAHATHPHTTHSSSKAHHHRKESRVSVSQIDLVDHVATSHNHTKNNPPQTAAQSQFHNHTYHTDQPSRKPAAMPAMFGPSNEPERKPIMHQVQQEGPKSRDPERERLPFPPSTQPQLQAGSIHQPATFQNQNYSGLQKQAQNLPNILRQNTPDKQKHLPSLSHTKNGSLYSSQEAPSTSHKTFAAQFWNSKATESPRTPAPAVSSNSAFNATLSQPGASAAYVPPKTYSPAAQSQSSTFKSNPVLQTTGPTNGSNTTYQSQHSFPVQGPSLSKGPPSTSQSFQTQAPGPGVGDNRIVLGMGLHTSKSEQPAKH